MKSLRRDITLEEAKLMIA